MQKSSLELRDDRSFKIKTAETIAEKAKKAGQVLSDEEMTETDALLAEAEDLLGEIERIERAEKQLERIADLSDTLRNPGRQTTTNEIADTTDHLIGSKIPAQYNKLYGTLKAFKGGESVEKDRYDAFSCGMWIRAKFFKDSRAHRWCEINGLFHNLAAEEGTASAGGDLVPSPLLDRLIVLRDEFGVFRRECDLIPMGRDTLSIPKLNTGTAATFVGESLEISESDATWQQVQLTAKKLGIVSRVSNELAEDAVINLADWLAVDMARSFALTEDLVGFAGAGTAAHGSITGIATTFTDNNAFAGAVDTATANADQFDELELVDLYTLMAALPAYARPNAKWYTSSTGHDLVFNRLAGAGGGNTIVTLQGGLGLGFLGHSIVISEQLPTSTGSLDNATMLLFGDLRMAAIMGDRRGISVVSSADRYIEFDQIAIRATERFDIAIHGAGDATNAGGIVALIGTA